MRGMGGNVERARRAEGKIVSAQLFCCHLERTRRAVLAYSGAQDEIAIGHGDPGCAIAHFNAVGARHLRIVRTQALMADPCSPLRPIQIDPQDASGNALAGEQSPPVVRARRIARKDGMGDDAQLGLLDAEDLLLALALQQGEELLLLDRLALDEDLGDLDQVLLVFGEDETKPELPPAPPVPADRAEREAPRAIPRPGLAGGTAELRGSDPERPGLT